MKKLREAESALDPSLDMSLWLTRMLSMREMLRNGRSTPTHLRMRLAMHLGCRSCLSESGI